MRTLMLLRHAKAVNGTATMDDKDRPLNDVGREACFQMGNYIRDHKLTPDLVLCSTAIRTRETKELVIKAAGAKVDVDFIDGLYLATAGEMLRFIQRVPNEVKSLMVIGHNPGTHNLALKLTHEGKPEAVELLEEKYPTCSLAVIAFDVDEWKKVAINSGKLLQFLTPKSLDA